MLLNVTVTLAMPQMSLFVPYRCFPGALHLFLFVPCRCFPGALHHYVGAGGSAAVLHGAGSGPVRQPGPHSHLESQPAI